MPPAPEPGGHLHGRPARGSRGRALLYPVRPGRRSIPDDEVSLPAQTRDHVLGPQCLARLLSATELDARLLGLVVALLVIWLGFNILSDGKFLTPRNLWFLTVQTATIAIMATGMVLVIVSRNIDLSVGSMLGFVGMIWAPSRRSTCRTCLTRASATRRCGSSRSPSRSPWAAIGAFQGFLIAYGGIPSFIVTLGGFLVWRGAAFQVAQGKTLAPMDRPSS